MMARRGFSSIVVFLDDFFILAPTYTECARALSVLLQLLRSLGFSIAWHKVVGPCTSLTFLGIDLDSISMTMKLPDIKQQKLLCLLRTFAARKRATRRQLQCLAGKLNWASQVIHGGRIFLRRILDMLTALHHPRHKMLLSPEFHLDVAWWSTYLESFNGVSCLPHEAPEFHVLTDASAEGAGFACCHDWGYVRWSTDLPLAANLHINEKEVLAVVLAAFRWTPLWRNSTVFIQIIRLQSTALKSKGIMASLGQLFWLSAIYDFRLQIVHVPGRFHLLPDTISRLHERGQLLNLLTILNSACHTSNCSHSYFPLHMSFDAFMSVYLQNHQMLNWSASWI